jgi:hypothetical protein
MPDDYQPRWPALKVTFVDTGETIRVNPRDGDVFHLEEDTGTSVQRMDWSWRATMRLAWFALRRLRDPRADVPLEAFVDLVDVEVWTDAEPEPGDQGKASDPAPPTG